MSTIKIHVAKLEPALFKWQQSEFKKIQAKQEELVDEYLSSDILFLFRRKPTRIEAAIYMDKEYRGWWPMLKHKIVEVNAKYAKLRLACSLAHDNVVTLDVEDVYRIFGESA